ncbi:MAG: enoyl-CoA hydratase [Alphaproteobacteria bacterium]|nr:enoyl-CoA hydratase [Alphaproteobacteria bacterium]
MTTPVEIAVDDRILRIRLTRPEKKNALTPAMYAALAEAFAGADRDPGVRVVLIGGTGDAFCSGNDVGTFVDRPALDAGSPVQRFMEALATLEKPLVAAVNGMAVGIGATMLLHCDLVLGARRARVRFPFADLGVVPEAASSLLLPRLIGQRRATELFLLGDWVDAETALAIGLFNRVVDDEALDAEALGLARRLAAKPPAALRATKAMTRDGLPPLVERLRHEAPIFDHMLRSPEAQEAFTAFLEKRKPDFTRFT